MVGGGESELREAGVGVDLEDRCDAGGRVLSVPELVDDGAAVLRPAGLGDVFDGAAEFGSPFGGDGWWEDVCKEADGEVLGGAGWCDSEGVEEALVL